eukprot:Nitzschia sp. Nitz4//scaffold85_size83877//7416//9320//NITZ4_005216-RA/size83877-processed-gene-0.115-mRNA-1//1//CDS//3329559098//6370//frame0
MLGSFWKRPSFWAGIVAVAAYWDSKALHGNYVYDDAGSVIKNPVVTGDQPWTEALRRDFWGQPMMEAASHKSFRPITTLTLRFNYAFARQQDPEAKHPPTFSFHVVNILLHGLVTALITESTYFVLPDNGVLSPLIVGFTFGLHPVHAEVVSNITSRGEILMSLFFCLAFLSYASTVTAKSPSVIRQIFGIYLVPWLGMTLSLFSKEQGATTLITLVAWDFLMHHGNLMRYIKQIREKDTQQQAIKFFFRTVVLAVQTLAVVVWRYLLNGETTPDFIEAQNPAGFASDRFTRAFSVTWVYLLYLRDALYPFYLSPDWSGVSIDLIKSLSDPRSILVLTFWYSCVASFWSLMVGMGSPPTSSPKSSASRNYWASDTLLRQVNMAVWAFAFFPFLLSSNILVVIGLMKADRVIYLPLFGFCLLEAIFLHHFALKGTEKETSTLMSPRPHKYWLVHVLVMAQLLIYSGKTHERNLAWSDSLQLWGTAYAINSKSYHTMYNYGYELSIKQKYIEAESVMRPIGDARVDGPSNTFVYAMVLFNLNRCDIADDLLDIAFEVIDERRREGGVRNTENHLGRSESNLLVARAHCIDDMYERARTMYAAVQADPTNEYAIGLATQVAERLKEYEKVQKMLQRQ